MYIEEMKKMLLNKEVTLRELARITGKDRDAIKKTVLSIANEEEKIRLAEVLEENKASSKVKIDANLKEILIQILKGKISAREASKLYGIDRETLRRKAEELANSSEEYKKYYIRYKSRRNDYSGINFRRLFVELIENNMTQVEIAEKYSVPPRTLTRELQKLGKSKNKMDINLYQMVKTIAEMHLSHKKPSDENVMRIRKFLYEIKENNECVMLEDENSEEKTLRELRIFKEEVDGLRKKGLTAEQISKELEIGVSTIRRRLLKLKELEEIREKRDGLEETDERE